MRITAPRWTKLAALMAAFTFGSSLVVATPASAAPPPEVHFLVKEVTVIRDGDPGPAAGCGEVDASLYIENEDGPTDYLVRTIEIRNTSPLIPTSNWPVQSWCEGVQTLATPGPVPGTNITSVNKAVIKWDAGAPLVLALGAWERDASDLSATVGEERTKEIKVPEKGHYIDTEFLIEKENEHGRLAVIFKVRVRSF